MANPAQIKKLFEKNGGKVISSPISVSKKLKTIKAFVFDWDGVFNNGEKDERGTSIFSEVDSMGTNLLRFAYWINNEKLPVTAIISGKKNSAAFYWSQRECFDSCYYKISKKTEALNHFCEQHNLKPSEIAFVFDDVLDLSVASTVGIKIFIPRKANPLFNQYVVKNKLADYTTGATSGNYAVREACELMMGFMGVYDKAITERMNYSAIYKNYITKRNSGTTEYFTKKGDVIVTEKANPIPINI